MNDVFAYTLNTKHFGAEVCQGTYTYICKYYYNNIPFLWKV